MWDRKNGPIIRTAVTLAPTATCPVAPLSEGLWLDSGDSQTKKRNAAAPYTDSGLMSSEGVIPAARLVFITDASDGDTITIGTKTFTFKTTLIAATTTTQVKRGTSAAATLGALIHAINGVTDALVVPDTTPFSASIVADAVTATVLRIRKANVQGGSPIAGTVAATTLSETLTPAASIWSAADLSVSGKAATDSKFAMCQMAVTAAMVTNASFQVELPFTPTCVLLFVTGSTGVQRASTDAQTISGNAVSIALGGGASPAIQAGDLLRIVALA